LLLRTHPRVRGQKRWSGAGARRGAGTFSPSQIAALSGWLRLTSSGQSAGEWTPSIVDIINPGSPMVQTDVDRRAAVGTSSNGYPTMVFDGTDVHLWPQSPAHSSTTKVGIWLWYKPATVSGLQVLYAVSNNIAGSTTARLSMYAQGTDVVVSAMITNANGRQGNTSVAGALAAGAWHAMYLQYDSSRGGDANLALFINGVSKALTYFDIGAGGTLGALQAASGSATIGGASDSDTPTIPIANGGEIGPNIFAFNDNLTASQIASLLAYEAPFAASQLSAVSAWLRLANGTVTGSGYSSVPDVLGVTAAAAQSTDARRPVNATSYNGLPIANFTDDFLVWPLSAANNQSVKNGFACWCKSTLSGLQNLFEIYGSGGGASANKLDFFTNDNSLDYAVFTGGDASRAAFMTANVWHFVTVEYDGTQATDQARLLITVDGLLLGTTNTSIPTSQPTPGGSANIGGFGNTQPWIGSIGPNFYALNRQLTTAERIALMNFEVPLDTSPLALATINGGPVGSWLRVANATSDVNGVSAVADVLQVNPAVQSVNALKPSLTVSTNGLPCLSFPTTGKNLAWPLTANNDNTSTVGVAFWMKATTVDFMHMFGIRNTAGGATADQIKFGTDNTGIIYATGFVSGANGRQGRTGASKYTAGMWVFVTLEYYDAGATEADRVTITVNGVVQTLSFINDGSGGTLGTLPAATGNAFISGENSAASSNTFVGVLGPNFYVLNARMAGATVGLLTTQARADLMAFEAPSNVAVIGGVAIPTVSGWLRNGTVGLVSSMPDVLNVANPATASGTARPTGNADGSMTFASPNNLSWAVAANNSAAVRFGIFAWIKPTSFAGFPLIVCARPSGADAYSLSFNTDGTLSISVWSSAGVRRQADTTRVFVLGTKYPMSFEYDGGQTAEADKCYLNMGNGKETLTFSVDTAMPAVARTPVGSIIIGAFAAAGGQPYAGDYGRNILALQGPGGISGGGLLTTAERASLTALEPL
jgi:hypothetical protein